MNEPSELMQGTTWSWTESFSDYPASTWTLTYNLIGESANKNIVATADGDDFDIAVTSAASAKFPPGIYRYAAYVDNGTERHQVSWGFINITPDLAEARFEDVQTYEEKVLAAIQCVIAGRATKDQENYSINNRSLGRTPIADLLRLESEFMERVKVARASTEGKYHPGKIFHKSVLR